MSNVIRKELLALEQDGVIKPERVVAWAKNHPASAIHKSLEWDDSIAAGEYREWQVRKLIAIHIVTVEGSRETVSLSIDRTEPGGGYRRIGSILKSKRLTEVMLNDALADLERLRVKYEHLQELAGVWKSVEKVRQRRKGGNKKAA